MVNALESKTFRIEKANEEYGFNDVKLSLSGMKETGFCFPINQIDELVDLLEQSKQIINDN